MMSYEARVIFEKYKNEIINSLHKLNDDIIRAEKYLHIAKSNENDMYLYKNLINEVNNYLKNARKDLQEAKEKKQFALNFAKNCGGDEDLRDFDFSLAEQRIKNIELFVNKTVDYLNENER